MGDVTTLFRLDPEALRCPYPLLDAVRDEHPVLFVPEIECWLVTRYADIVQVARDPQTFSSKMPTGPVLARQQLEAVQALLADEPELAGPLMRQGSQARVLLSADPPDHARQRRLINPAFTPPKVKALEPRIRQVADELVDRFAARGRAEIVHEFGVLLPLTIIAECLGVADDELPQFKTWSDNFVAVIGNHSMSRDELRSLLLARTEFYDYFSEKIAARRAQPTSDLISDLVHGAIDDEPLTDDEILAMLNQFLVAGNETTTKLIAFAVHMLLQEPARIDELRADPGRIAGFVEEVLRLQPPVQGLYRTATADTTLGRMPIKAGDHVMLVYAAGNRDGDRFAEPESIDPCRAHLMSHLAFGNGEHYCPGSALARAEGRIAVETLLDRLDHLRPAAGVDLDRLDYEPSYVLHGIRELHVEFDERRG